MRYSCGLLHRDVQRQDDLVEPKYNSSVPIRDVALRTCQKQWTIGKGGERVSGISVLIVWHDDDGSFNFSFWYGQIVGQTEFFNLGRETDAEEKTKFKLIVSLFKEPSRMSLEYTDCIPCNSDETTLLKKGAPSYITILYLIVRLWFSKSEDCGVPFRYL